MLCDLSQEAVVGWCALRRENLHPRHDKHIHCSELQVLAMCSHGCSKGLEVSGLGTQQACAEPINIQGCHKIVTSVLFKPCESSVPLLTFFMLPQVGHQQDDILKMVQLVWTCV